MRHFDLIDLQTVMVIDIETVPQHGSYRELSLRAAELWEQKTSHLRRNGESPEETYPRAGIWAEFGKVVCISTGKFRVSRSVPVLQVRSFYGEDERQLLCEFSNFLQDDDETWLLCAHNGREFDFPYLCRRFLINGLRLPPELDMSGRKPWEITHFDTMELWKFGDYKNYTSLELLSLIFGLESSKSDLTGADIHRVYWEDHDLGRIRRYCERDVMATAQLFMRLKNLVTASETLQLQTND